MTVSFRPRRAWPGSCGPRRLTPAWTQTQAGLCHPGSAGLAWKKHKPPPPPFFFNAALSALFEIAYLSGHELLMRWGEWGWENAEGEEEEHTRKMDACNAWAGRCLSCASQQFCSRGAEVCFFCPPPPPPSPRQSCLDSVACILELKHWLCCVVYSLWGEMKKNAVC